ncbi:hypothetical protein LSH36_148g01013 [Paralvinella palmiformis]|uniref:C2H2-type domain-containing protein n=1 Tax=Paralvinella palmiformis TaxID=53620 RepID=A0AAD9JVW5_9ANNE|nr:hypothetical protein LSH36_148g01013 [Paralvinella palmiformis]
MEVQRQRLKHLMANAILELWKKETGSLSSVIIEGTICITSGNGTTIVVQVADKFLGVIPDGSSAYSKSRTPPDRSPYRKVGDGRLEDVKHEEQPTRVRDFIDSRANSSALVSTSYLADVSSNNSLQMANSHSRQEPNLDSRRWSSCSDQVFYPPSKKMDSDTDSDSDGGELVVDNQDNDVDVQLHGPAGSCSMAEELSSSGYSSLLSKSSSSTLERSQVPSSVYLASPDGGRHDDKRDCHILTPLRRRSASPAMIHSPSTSTPIDESKRRRLQEVENGQEGRADSIRKVHSEGDAHDIWASRISHGHMSRSLSGSALDLSSGHRDHELALSPPQNYTAQVRDVIRSRILATKSSDSQTVMPSVIVSSSESSVRGPSTSFASVTVDTSGSTAYHLTAEGKSSMPPLYPHISSSDIKTSLPDLKLPLLPPSGPASWPVAGQDKQNVMPPPPPLLGNGRLLLPGNFSLLSVGLPNGPPLMPGSLSPSLFPSFFPPGIIPRGMPLPPGVNIGSLPTLSSTPLLSPKTPSSQGSTTPSTSLQENEEGRFWEYTSGRSTPEVTDINGNSEKQVTPTGEQKVYVCEYCSKQFLFKSKYHEHLPVHTNARPYQCHLCSRTYKYKYDLQVHLRTHMGIPTKSTVCPFCMQKFETNKMLRNHIVEMHRDRQKVTKEECTQPVDNLPPAL